MNEDQRGLVVAAYLIMSVCTAIYTIGNDRFILGKAAFKAPTRDARTTILILGSIMWPLWVVFYIHLLPLYLWYTVRGVGMIFGIFFRGIRDLMPRRAAKIPKATLLTKDP